MRAEGTAQPGPPQAESSPTACGGTHTGRGGRLDKVKGKGMQGGHRVEASALRMGGGSGVWDDRQSSQPIPTQLRPTGSRLTAGVSPPTALLLTAVTSRSGVLMWRQR